TIDLLARAPGVTLVALFSPEHGIRGVLDDTVPSSRDEKTGLPIHSLYGDTRRPTAAMLEGLDTLVVDLQDIGARFYTYPATVGYVLEEAARRKLPVVVLDRPNPVDGFDVEGPIQDASAIGFTGYLPMPTRDRKSTRLNSSHGSISYAVFCLKKKNSCSTRCCRSSSSGSGAMPTHTTRGRRKAGNPPDPPSASARPPAPAAARVTAAARSAPR